MNPLYTFVCYFENWSWTPRM